MRAVSDTVHWAPISALHSQCKQDTKKAGLQLLTLLFQLAQALFQFQGQLPTAQQ